MKFQKMQFDEVLLNYEAALTSTGIGYSSRLRMLKQAAGINIIHHVVEF